MRGLLKCCSQILGGYIKKTINSPWNNREALREISIHISMWLSYYNIEGKLLLLSILTLTSVCFFGFFFFFCIFYYILEDCSYEVLAPLTRMTFSMSFDGHQWNIPVESYLFTFMSMFSICSFPGIRRGSCRLRKQNIHVLYTILWNDCSLVVEVLRWKRQKTTLLFSRYPSIHKTY